MTEMNDNPKCDRCEKDAVVNYQSCLAVYRITNGDYELVENDPTEHENTHACAEHDPYKRA